MPAIQAETDPNTPYPKHTFWFWELTNIFVPLFGILFLDWHIFTLVFLFWWELICWGSIGVLKILTAGGSKSSFLVKVASNLITILFFVPLYLGLFLIVFSFSFTEFDTESMINVDRGFVPSMIIIGISFLIEYIRSEILTGRFTIRNPYGVVMERMLYALPLACLVLFAVIPLSERFEGSEAEKIIGLGIIISKFIIDLVAHYLSGLMITYNDMTNDEGDPDD